MLIGFSDGRFGNQLFQLAALLTAQKNREFVVAFGFEDLPESFSAPRLVTIRGASRKRSPRLGAILRRLASQRVLSEIVISRQDRSFRRKKALIFGVALFTNRYLQVADAAETTHIARLHSISAHELLGEGSRSHDPFIFVHIRRGDYLEFPSRSESASLPSSYYSKGLSLLSDRHPGVRVVVFSDDPVWVHSQPMFRDYEVCAKPTLESWVLMSTAIGGVLSASSFSYWAAKVAQHRLEPADRGLFIAPKYWLGWRIQSWLPRDIASNSFTYIDVPSGADNACRAS